MDKQPEALRLADQLEEDLDGLGPRGQWIADNSAAELRRQHGLIAELVEALEDMHQVLQEAMSTGGWVPTPVQASFRAAWIDMTAAIAKATGGAA